MYSSVRSATHHIFFPPRLEVVVEQQNPDRLSSHPRNQLSFHRFFGYQTDRPARATFWRGGAHHCDDPLLLVVVQHFGGAGPLLLIKRAVESGLLVTVAEPANRLCRDRDGLGNMGSTDTLCQLQERQGPENNADLLHATFQEAA